MIMALSYPARTFSPVRENQKYCSKAFIDFLLLHFSNLSTYTEKFAICVLNNKLSLLKDKLYICIKLTRLEENQCC